MRKEEVGKEKERRKMEKKKNKGRKEARKKGRKEGKVQEMNELEKTAKNRVRSIFSNAYR